MYIAQAQHFVSEYGGQTTIHPLGLIVLLVAGLFLVTLPRRYAIWPIIAIACLVAPAQRVVVATLDFNTLRLMVLFGALRVAVQSEWQLQWKPIDSAVAAWTMWMVIVSGAMTGSSAAFINKLGYGFDAIGMYFLFRLIVRDFDDVTSIALGFIVVSIPVAIAFLFERSTRHNPFSIFGGVPAITAIRDGRLRCQGAFAHPILAGCFWAAVLPILVAQWRPGLKRYVVIAGVGSMALIIFACSSSTPVMAVLFGMLGVSLFPFRRMMRYLRWGLLVIAVLLHLSMEKGIWHLYARLNVIGGSTGWHRYHLIDQAIAHWNEWFYLGTSVGTAHWGYGLFDVTNYFVVNCLRGGIIEFLLLILVIALGFQGVGRIWRSVEPDQLKVRIAWGLGISLFVHVNNFMGVSYFGQIYMMWYLSLAMIGSLTPSRARLRRQVASVANSRSRELSLRPTGRSVLGG